MPTLKTDVVGPVLLNAAAKSDSTAVVFKFTCLTKLVKALDPTLQSLSASSLLIIKRFGAVDKPCFIVPLLPVPVNETIENPEISDTLPALSILPILVELASLVNDVPAFQFHATIEPVL